LVNQKPKTGVLNKAKVKVMKILHQTKRIIYAEREDGKKIVHRILIKMITGREKI